MYLRGQKQNGVDYYQVMEDRKVLVHLGNLHKIFIMALVYKKLVCQVPDLVSKLEKEARGENEKYLSKNYA